MDAGDRLALMGRFKGFARERAELARRLRRLYYGSIAVGLMGVVGGLGMSLIFGEGGDSFVFAGFAVLLLASVVELQRRYATVAAKESKTVQALLESIAGSSQD